MKRFAFALALIVSSCSGGQILPVADRQAEFIDQTGIDKATAYKKALAHLSKTFGDANAAMKVRDEAGGQIVAIGNVTCNSTKPGYLIGADYSAKFTLDFQAKDKRTRILFEDVHIIDDRGTVIWDGQVTSKAALEKIKAECLDPIHKAILSAITDTKKAASDNW